MRKSVAAYWVFAASFVLVHSLMMAEAKAQVPDRVLSFRDVALQLHTPEDIAHYMWRNFRFETDRALFGEEEYWQSAEEILVTQQGDCEDFAVFAHEVLKLNGVSSFLLNVYGDQFAHTVCVFKENGKYSIIDGDHVLHFEADNIRDLMAQIYPFWKKGALVTPSPTSRSAQQLTEIERSIRANHRLATSA